MRPERVKWPISMTDIYDDDGFSLKKSKQVTEIIQHSFKLDILLYLK